MRFLKYIIPTVVLLGFASASYLHYSGVTNLFSYSRGIDVSAHQGKIDWSLVAKDKIAFAYVKATEADDFKDQKFIENWNNAKKAGIAVGAYHYFSLAYGGEVQANNFIASVPVEAASLPPVVDLEYVGNSNKRPDKAEFQKELKVFLEMIERQYGKRPIIYTTREFSRDYLYPEMTNQPLWIRSLFIPPQKDWQFWQFSQWGKVDGIDVNVDLDYFNGNSEELRKL